MPNKIYATGDLHANIIPRFSFAKNPYMRQLDDTDVMVCLGDIGIMWPGCEKEGAYTLDWMNKQKYTFLLVRGNHDNETWWSTCAPTSGYASVKCLYGDLRMAQIGNEVFENVLLVSNTAILDICGKKCLVIGGAQSTDAYNLAFPHEKTKIKTWKKQHKWYRVVGQSWWPGETIDITYANSVLFEAGLPCYSRLVATYSKKYANKYFDYIFTHQAPAAYIDAGLANDRLDRRVPNYEQEFLDSIAGAFDYTKWYHGHMHRNIEYNDNMACLFYNTVLVR